MLAIKLRYLVRIAGESNIPFIVEDDMLQTTVWNVLYYMPLDGKETAPLIDLPEVHVFVEVDQPHHLGHSNKLPTFIHLKREKKLPVEELRITKTCKRGKR